MHSIAKFRSIRWLPLLITLRNHFYIKQEEISKYESGLLEDAEMDDFEERPYPRRERGREVWVNRARERNGGPYIEVLHGERHFRITM